MIVGTAGHIDHGKTALVQALTGVDADRLREEKARGITIDLGFAYLRIDDDQVLGFVDVPGHDKFIRNMLAGATGIDYVVLIVAADDGVMPQTKEHLDIVNLLGLSRGLVALTKCDLVSKERRDEVRDQIGALLQGTLLADAPTYDVSAVTGEGVAELRDALVAQAGAHVPEGSAGLFRLAVDRRFTLQGVGTVVTGAVTAGRVDVGDSVVISPTGTAARVRAIHAQNQPAEFGVVGQRCALNLAGDGVSVDAIKRGDVIMDAAAHGPSEAVDGELVLLDTEPRSLSHWTPVRLHHGASEIGARVALLQNEDILPGATGRVQLVLEKPIAATVGDRFIIRDTSGARTMGGGRLIDLRGPRRRRRTPQRLAQLEALSIADTAECLNALLNCAPYCVDIAGFARDRAMSAPQLHSVLAKVPHVCTANGRDELIYSKDVWASLKASALSALEEFHRNYPQLIGPGVAWLAKALEPRQLVRHGSVVVRQLVADGILASQGGALRLPGHQLALDKADHQLWQRIVPHLSGENRFRPPQGRECAEALGAREIDVRRVLKAMAKQKTVVELARDRFFLQDTLREIASIVADIAAVEDEGWFPAAALRNRLQNGRKVSIEVLEYFDRHGLTFRQGDLRRIVPQKINQYVAAGVSTKGTPAATREENRPRWGVRTSNPGGAVSQS